MRASPNLGPYALAAFAIAIAWLVRHLADPYLGDRLPFGFFLLAIVFATWRCGVRAGAFALLLSLPIAWYFFITPRHSFSVEGRIVYLIALFCIAGGIMAFLALLRRAEHVAQNGENNMRERERLHKDAQTALQTAHARFWSFVDSIPAKVFIKDEAGRYVFLNEAGHKYLGDAAIGKTDRELMPSDVAERLAATDRKVRESGAPLSFREKLPLPDGQLVDLLTTKFLLQTAEGPMQLGGVALDISAAQRAQEELGQRKSELETLFYTLPVPVWMAQDAQCDTVQANQVATDLGLGSVKQTMQHCIAQNRVLEGLDMEFEGAEGGPRRIVRVTAAPLTDAEGKARGAVAVGVHVAETQRSVDALRESERRFRQLADSAPVMIWVAGTDKQFNYLNRQWLDFSGRDPEQELGLGWADAIHPDDYARAVATYNECFDQRKDLVMEYRLLRRDGEYRWILDKGVPHYAVDGAFEGYVGTCTDIGDIKEAQTQLQEADRQKDEFLAILAHELRNPLAPVRNALFLLARGQTDEATLSWALGVMTRQINQLARLVDELLDVTRVTKGQVVLQKAQVPLETVVRDALETTQPLIEEAGHRLEVALPPEAIFVNVDATRLAQVLINVLTNAVKYTPHGGDLRLSAEKRGDEVLLRIRDNGIGIPAEYLTRIFGMFSQGEHWPRHMGGGLGVGLGLARQFVELHGGRIEAHSRGVGLGSEFLIFLPLDMGQGPAVETPRPVAKEAPVLGGKRILVVDDNMDSADSLGLILQSLGHEVEKAYNGVGALSSLDRFPADCVFLDIGLPDIDGYEVARSIRGMAAKAIKLIALTGWAQERDRERAFAAGFDIHLTKPVSPERLLEVLGSI